MMVEIQRLSAEEKRRTRIKLANEFLTFRQTFLFRQVDLAQALHISRRTVQAVEAGYTLPSYRTRQNFLELKQQFVKRRAA
jgi:DNA-binding XRE family transcriptional regulator